MKSPPLALPSEKQLQRVAQKYGLRFIVLFGSAARGRAHEESDARRVKGMGRVVAK
jgi:predicted nucleotidyltransferase